MRASNPPAGAVDLDRALSALSAIPPDLPRADWLRVVAASVAAGLPAESIHSWSAGADTYERRALDSVLRGLSPDGGIGPGTLFYIAKQHGWHDDAPPRRPSPEEIAQHQVEREARAAAEAAARQARADDAAAEAVQRLAAAGPADPAHPYLSKKRVAPTPDMRQEGRALLVPVADRTGNIRGLQIITANGTKHFQTGARVTRCWWWSNPPADAAPSRIFIGEGVATALSVAEATGEPTAAAFSTSNLPAVAAILRDLFPDADIVIAGDADAHQAGQHAAEKAAATAGASVRLPVFADPGATLDGKPAKDFNDLARLEGPEAVRRQLLDLTDAPAPEPPPPPVADPPAADEKRRPRVPDAAIIASMASLSPIDYDRMRTAAAKELGVRAGTLDALVAATRKEPADNAIGFADCSPWPAPVDPAQLLSEIVDVIHRFIVCQPETAHAVALWVAMSWLMDVVQVAPLAVITAPEKRCGKSQLLALLGKLCRRPLTASNISAAALFRTLDAWSPTLLVDEADAFMKENEELRGLLNAGHTRDSAYVVRLVGDSHTPAKFNVWGAKALAGIGHLAETLMDRAIVLELRRKLPTESVERQRHAEPGLFDGLAAKLARFAADFSDQVQGARPDLPAALNDRAQDNWEPLLAIAGVAGGPWPNLALRAALKLSSADSAMSSGTELLADIQDVFDARGVDQLSTKDLIIALCEDDEKCWATFNRGKSVTPRQISRRLSGYGITSKDIRFGFGVAKGYLREWFEEAFSRYLDDPSASATPQQPNNGAGFGVADSESVAATKGNTAPAAARPCTAAEYAAADEAIF